MNIDASIVDQQLTGLIDKYANLLSKANTIKQRATAFVLLCIKYYLDISLEEAVKLLTDGGNDDVVDLTFTHISG